MSEVTEKKLYFKPSVMVVILKVGKLIHLVYQARQCKGGKPHLPAFTFYYTTNKEHSPWLKHFQCLRNPSPKNIYHSYWIFGRWPKHVTPFSHNIMKLSRMLIFLGINHFVKEAAHYEGVDQHGFWTWVFQFLIQIHTVLIESRLNCLKHVLKVNTATWHHWENSAQIYLGPGFQVLLTVTPNSEQLSEHTDVKVFEIYLRTYKGITS